MTGDRIALLDVGHGNGAVLHIDNQVCVIDAGPGTTLLEYIQANSITSIDLVVLSHADQDHIGGLLGLLVAGNVPIKRVLLNTNSEKESKVWAGLVHELNLHWQNKGLQFDVGLTAQDSPIAIGSATLEILSPSPGLAAMGAGSRTSDGRRITSNTVSVVIRVIYNGQPVTLLTGDMDGIALDEMLSRKVPATTSLLVFPHHGGASGTRSADFATKLLGATKPDSVVFSVGRGRFGNPKKEIVDAVRTSNANTRVICTQLNEECASKLPKETPTHLTSLVAHGRQHNRCCAGTVVLKFGQGGGLFPRETPHREFIKLRVPGAMCQ